MENQPMTMMAMSNSTEVVSRGSGGDAVIADIDGSNNKQHAAVVDGATAAAVVAAIADDSGSTIAIGDAGDATGTAAGSSSSSSNKSSKSGLTLKGKSITINGSVKSNDLNEHDVVCEKGRGDHERWPGNKLYRHLVNQYKETYNDLPPVERSSIIGKIISSIQEKDGWFVQHNDKTVTWTKLTEEKVRKKVSDDLRREIRRRREKRSHNSVFSAKLRAIKKMEDANNGTGTDSGILEPVCDPQPADVLFGPGARRHPGNKMYWNLMKVNLDQYIISPYGARSVISRNIVQCVSNQLGRFLEQDPKTGTWYHITGKRAIEKTSHALSNMKYKTRKSGATDSNSGANNNDEPIDFRLAPGSFEDMMAYDDDHFSETVFAKKRTKKFRFLSRRMDDDEDNLTLESKGSLKSAGSLDGPMMLKNHHGQQQQHHNYHPTLLSTPPVPGMTKLPVDGKIISPNEHSTLASKSEETRDDYHEYQEQQTPNGTFDGYYHHHGAPGFPDGSEFVPIPLGSNGYSGNMPAADIGPRPSQYDAYLKGYGVTPPYKPLSYDYPHHHNPRGYNYGSAYPIGGGGGHGMAPPHLPLHQQPMANDKSAGYWDGNEWANQQQQRVDGGYY